MGGRGPAVMTCAAEIYREWAACQHFLLYDDVPAGLRALSERNIRIGLISNSHRCLESFQSHFELDEFIDVAISSLQHGYMKPHPSIFEAALRLAGVDASESVMVGDSLSQDIEGARRVGMRGVLVHRSDTISLADPTDVPVIKSLRELPDLL
jgi:putative hydrolase of the HAD superfamily